MPGPRDTRMDMGIGRDSDVTQASGQYPSGMLSSGMMAPVEPGSDCPPRQLSASQERLAMLSRAIEAEVIPRLILARRPGVLLEASGPLNGWTPAFEDVADLARLAIARDETLASARLRALHERGVPLDTLYMDLLGPAARHLGVLWEDDEIGFTDVTTGTWRLRQAMYELSPVFLNEAEAREQKRRVLLLPAIGEQHSLGMLMVAEFFRRSGWDVRCEMVASDGDLARIVQREWFDMVGFSVGADDRLDSLRASIAVSRQASRNLQVVVMAGGPVFLHHPELVASVGADGTAADPAQAAALAEHLIHARADGLPTRSRQAGPG